MADIPTTPASVSTVADRGQTNRTHNAGESIEAGDAIYLDTTASPNVWKLLGAGIAITGEGGLASNSAATGQPVAAALTGARVAPGGLLAAGQVVVASRTAPGNISPQQDLQSGDNLHILGHTNGQNEIVLDVNLTGVVRS